MNLLNTPMNTVMCLYCFKLEVERHEILYLSQIAESASVVLLYSVLPDLVFTGYKADPTLQFRYPLTFQKSCRVIISLLV